MELNYLREFIVLARTGNFLEAAEQLFISQSSLSKHIKRLETELGVALFDRTTRKVELSQHGQVMLDYAQQMVQIQDAYTEKFAAVRQKEQNTLEIGSIPALAPYNITAMLARFRQENNVALHITQSGTLDLQERLLQGKLELAFVREMEIPKSDGFVRLPYTADKLVAVFPTSHPLADREAIALEELKQEEFLLIEKPSLLYDISYNACVGSGFTPHVAFTDHKPDHLVDFVQKEMGVALLMKRLAAYLQNPNTSIVEVTPTVSTQICLCHKKGAHLSDAAKQFWACAKRYIEESGSYGG